MFIKRVIKSVGYFIGILYIRSTFSKNIKRTGSCWDNNFFECEKQTSKYVSIATSYFYLPELLLFYSSLSNKIYIFPSLLTSFFLDYYNAKINFTGNITKTMSQIHYSTREISFSLI